MRLNTETAFERSLCLADADAGAGSMIPWARARNRTATGVAMIFRCIDNLFQTAVLVEGREYEVRAERDNCYILASFDKGFSKTRFEIAPSSSIGGAPGQRAGQDCGVGILVHGGQRGSRAISASARDVLKGLISGTISPI